MSKKIFEINGKQSKYPLELDILKADGSFEEYYLIVDGEKSKIGFDEMVKSQIDIVSDETNHVLSGNGAKQASSGDYTRHSLTGKYGVVFACGFKSTIKVANKTCISLCDYKKDEESRTRRGICMRRNL